MSDGYAEIRRQYGLKENMPRHIGIIMDGNGRWAAKRSLPRGFGHRAGMERLRGIITLSRDIGLEALSLYAFSTENWARPAGEVEGLFSLLVEYFRKEIEALHRNHVQVRVMGDIASLPDATCRAVEQAVARTRDNTGLKLNIALNYGSRSELLRAVRAFGAQTASGALLSEQIGEAELMDALYTAGLPELDLLIRTGGEQRLSNFMLVQAAYAELMFLNDYFPDFSDEKYIGAISAFQCRSRRFGGLKAEDGV